MNFLSWSYYHILISFVYTFVCISVYIFIGISLYKITDCFVDVKENKILKLIAFIGLSVIASVVIYVSDIVNVVYNLIAYIVIMLICYKGSIIKRISPIMVLYPIIVSFNFLGHVLVQTIFLRRILALALFWYVIYNVMKDKILYAKQYINDKAWILIDIICAAPLISIVSTIIFTGYDEKYKAYIIAIVCIFSNIGVMFLIQYIVDSVKVRLDNKNYRLQYDYYKSLEEKQLEVRKIYHDMSNHLQVISSCIKNNGTQEAKVYFQNLEQKVTLYKNRVFCKKNIVNAIINNKYNLMVENHIDCSINISIDDIISIDDMDLCSIFANTLDNAIEASLKIKEPSNRKITVKARINKGYFSYAITNRKDQDILTYKETIISSKSDKKHHGFGLQNLKDIVDKYKGNIDISYNDIEFSVVVIIRDK
ncbi:sensor histidine kinase [Clostridium aciditolerans]|uniref:GHKL domain-containing protein n=1 Tax=Clostridium aciditolerans TaxID=339861 RepID=A0A934HU18_9CLOT|nr:sensor histidine kinase [Clostridium aciditolerans]MBI6873303.1 GHKL domain-containing protein [Clostridium aciditolerans]